MIILPGNPLIFRVQYLNNGVGKTGLTPTVNVYKTTVPGLINTVYATGESTTEIDSVNFPGMYQYTVSAIDNDVSAMWLVHFFTDDTTVQQKEIVTQWYVLANQAFGPPGVYSYEYVVTNTATGNPEPGVTVWITTDITGIFSIWSGTTNTFGIAIDSNGNQPLLNAGTYYFWKYKAGFIDNQEPDTEVVP